MSPRWTRPDAEVRTALHAAGFADHRHEHEYRVPVRNLAAPVPDGIRIVTGDATEVEPLMLLDCALREDVPGGARR